jgi:DNA-binding response OmpR family regulator
MKRILIVEVIEDDPTLSTALADNLRKEGFEVLRAKDGQEGLNLALSAKPDLILLDLRLPKMDGLIILDKLRQDPWGKNVQVIVLSNSSNPSDVASAIDSVNEYLVKVDWKIEDVIKKVRDKLKV